MQGCSCTRVLVACWMLLSCAEALSAERSPQQETRDRLQQQERLREQQRLDESFLPERGVKTPEPESEDTDGPCFPINDVILQSPDDAPLPFPGWLREAARFADPECVRTSDIRRVQQRLSERLIEHGYVTSRVLLPEQDISDGEISFLIVPGRVGGHSGEGMPDRLVRSAMPGRTGHLLNLRDLEQAVENLGRVPGLDARLDLLPGERQGETVILGRGEWPRRTRGSLVVNSERHDGMLHSTARAGFEVASPLGMTDRLSLAVNSDLDREISDRAQGASLDYELVLGHWFTSLGARHQEYENTVPGFFQDFDSEGHTRTATAELGRVIRRTAHTRVALAGLLGHNDVRNRLQDATVRVSSYRLTTAGLRVDFRHHGRLSQWGGGLTLEHGYAGGPATRLPDDLEIAEQRSNRLRLFTQFSRPMPALPGELSTTLVAQFSNDRLFPLQQISLASASAVRGFEGMSVTANSAFHGSVEYSHGFESAFPGLHWRPFVALDGGRIPGKSNEPDDIRMASAVAGIGAAYRRTEFTLEAAHPIAAFSSRMPDSDLVLRGRLALQF